VRQEQERKQVGFPDGPVEYIDKTTPASAPDEQPQPPEGDQPDDSSSQGTAASADTGTAPKTGWVWGQGSATVKTRPPAARAAVKKPRLKRKGRAKVKAASARAGSPPAKR
jgi:hypothetical protein